MPARNQANLFFASVIGASMAATIGAGAQTSPQPKAPLTFMEDAASTYEPAFKALTAHAAGKVLTIRVSDMDEDAANQKIIELGTIKEKPLGKNPSLHDILANTLAAMKMSAREIAFKGRQSARIEIGVLGTDKEFVQGSPHMRFSCAQLEPAQATCTRATFSFYSEPKGKEL